jgi:gamma-polyglutamate biosynthesis protein CapA
VNRNGVTLTAVGDIFLGEHPVTLNHGVATVVKQNGCAFLFEEMAKYLGKTDIVCGNLEGIISPKSTNNIGIESSIFWGPHECASALHTIGFNCLFLANNHNAQHGKEALQRTCNLLDENEIRWTGFNAIDPQSPTPACFDVEGLRVALLSYCESQQYRLDEHIMPIIDYERIEQDVSNLKKDGYDILVISLHWGDEFIDYPSPTQVTLAHKIIDLGVHLILGHHSHTFQGIERYKNGLIAYSLGSFVKDLWPRKLRESVILSCTLNRDSISHVDIIPIFINDKYQPVPCDPKTSAKLLNRFRDRSAMLEKPYSSSLAIHESRYKRDVKKLLAKDRFGTLVHYLTHLGSYDKKVLFENIRLMVKRRIYKKNI